MQKFFASKGSSDNFYKYREKIPTGTNSTNWAHNEPNCYFVDYRAIFQEFRNLFPEEQREKLSLSHRLVRLILVTYVIHQCHQNASMRFAK